MYRNIVVLLDDRVISSNVLNVATNIAKESDGYLKGVYVLPLTSSMISMPDVVDIESFRAKANEVHEVFDSVIKAADVKGDWNYTEGGDVVTEVTRQGLYADLIVLSRNEHNNATADKIILTASCPTLQLPSSSASNGIFDRILVAWKSTREAAGALHDTLPLLHKANSITIVSFEEPNNLEKQSLKLYLNTHGIDAKIDQQPINNPPGGHGLLIDIDTSIGDKVLTRSKEEKSDLIVMGAYGHSRLSEIIFSGVTHHVSRNVDIPVLMSH